MPPLDDTFKPDPKQVALEVKAAQAKANLAKAQEGIGARFETQTSIDEANERRDKEWREAYARIGQEPPKKEEAVYDGRTLFDKLQAHKDANQLEWDEKMKLSNQYRGVDAEELRFLNDRAAERMAAERKIADEERRELGLYREALAAKHVSTPSADSPGPPSALPASASSSAPKRLPPPHPKAIKKDVKSLMKGVMVKKKPKPAEEPKSASTPPTAGKSSGIQSALKVPEKRVAEGLVEAGDGEKRQRLDP